MSDQMLNGRLPDTTRPLLIGAPNFRDLGGIPSADGRRIKPRMIYRSGEFSSLSDEDLETLRGLGIGVICDLRNETERDARPNRWPNGSSVELLPVEKGISTNEEDMWRYIRENPTEGGVLKAIHNGQRMLPGLMARPLGLILGRLLEGGSPLVFHCTAGRDRTGFISACVLRALGVPQNEVAADYMRSAHYMSLDDMAAKLAPVLEMLVGADVPRLVVDAMNTLTPSRLEQAFVWVTEEFGSLDAYLASVGIESAEVSRLRDLLLD